MFLSVFLFELRKRRKMVSTYVFFGVLFAAAFLFMNVSGGAFDDSASSFGNKVLANSPRTLMFIIGFLSAFSITVLSALFSRATAQDFETDMHALYFASPMSTSTYFFARYLGALVTYAFVATGAVAGLFVGRHMPYLDAASFGPDWWASYLRPYLLLSLPNAVFLGAIFFSVAALSRRAFIAQTASVVVMVAYLISSRALTKLDDHTLADLIDPFGITAFAHITDYWSVAQKNALQIPFAGMLLVNRLMWVAAGLVVLVASYLRFQRTFALREKRATPRELTDTAPSTARGAVEIALGTRAFLPRLPALAWLELKASVRHRSFLMMTFCGVLFMIVASRNLGQVYDTATYPVTYLILEEVAAAFTSFFLVVTTYFGADLIWRERDAKMAQITDALPAPTWLSFGSKLLALFGIQTILTLVIMITGMLIQLASGYTQLEPWLYVRQLFFINLPQFFMLAVLVMFVQSVVNDKNLGHFIMVVYYVGQQFEPQMGLEHRLYDFAGTPPVTYSALNGYGHFVAPTAWFLTYWACFCLVLVALTPLAVVRGTETGWRERFAIARGRWPSVRVFFAVSLVATLTTGSYIFYNTNILNQYKSSFAREEISARYEREYRHFLTDPGLKIQSVNVQVDFYPELRSMDASGRLGLANKSGQPVSAMLVTLPPTTKLVSLAVPGGAITKRDEALGAYVVSFTPPIVPGATLDLTYEVSESNHGFRNDGENNRLVANGSFFDSERLPILSYNLERELTQDGLRKKHHLELHENTQPPPDTPGAADHNALSTDADWIKFSAIVSTSPDQIAIAPGYLRREWNEGGRRFFAYEMDTPIGNIYSFQSGRFEVLRDKWNEVALEIYYHKGHEYNLERMRDGLKASLAYLSSNFGPYQFRQARIIEFPRYENFAESFPNTIPFSESIGFIARVDPASDSDIDYPFFVTAHEIAHQWWAHQLLPAHAQGEEFLTESLAEYSALMVMKHARGDSQMQRFLRHELDEYLKGRGRERNRERPLMTVENQPYIHYSKGSLALYALQDVIGEKTLNDAIAGFLKTCSLKGPPYPLSPDFVAALSAATPEADRYLIEDLFKTITLYDNRATAASVKTRADGKFDLTITYSAKKYRSEGLGEEHDQPMEDWVEFGGVDKDGRVTSERKRVASGDGTITLTVEHAPVKAGIDPSHKLIDRKPDDNLVSVTTAGS